MANANFHVSFFFLISSRISNMKKIVPPPPLLHQNHFSSTSVKTKRRKSSFLLRRKNFNLISSTTLMLGHHKLRMTMLLFLCILNTLTVTLAKEALQGDEKHPLVIFAESQESDTKSLLLEEQQREKREGRQYEYNDQNNPQRSSSNSRQKSPQDLVSGKNNLDILFYLKQPLMSTIDAPKLYISFNSFIRNS